MWLIFVAAGVLVGLVVGRFLALAAVIPFALWMAQSDGLEGDLEIVVAVAGSVFSAAGILAGVFARRFLRRQDSSS